MLFGSRLNKLATSIRRALSEYAVLGINPPFVADFIEKKYLTGGASSTFSNAINHARAGNAVMTDGYGPELVVNGGFDSDSDWTKGTGWSIADGVATANTTLSSDKLRSADPYQGANGKTYIVTATFTMLATPNANAGVRINIGGVGENVFIQSERSLQAGQTYTISGFGTPTSVSGDFYVAVSSTAHYAMNYTIDNISVREMPAIKWAPHNLQLNSESSTGWGANNVLFTDNALSDPFGGNKAIKVEIDVASTPTNRCLRTTSVGIAGVQHTQFIYIKAGSGVTHVSLNCATGDARFQLSDGAKTFESTGVSATSTSLADGWFLFTLTFTPSTTYTPFLVYLSDRDASTATGFSGGEFIYMVGVSLHRSDLGGMVDNPERGDSYVPTASRPFGPELFSDFDLEGEWVDGGDGSYTVTNATANTDLRNNNFVTSGKTYEYKFTITGDTQTVYLGNTNPELLSAGTYTKVVTANTNWFIFRAQIGETATVSNISVKETVNPASARYLPRVGHHVFNGDAWVNEGVLAESEQRVNLITYSEDFTDASWSKTRVPSGGLNFDGVGPDGQEDSAVKLIDDSGTGTGQVYIRDAVSVSASTAYTFSVFAKKDQLSWIKIGGQNFTTPSNGGVFFNLEDGTLGTEDSGYSGVIQSIGNGWYRCSVTFTTDATDTTGGVQIQLADSDNDVTVDLDGTSSVLIYGAQFEAGSTPSSYIPTSGQQGTREAESFTIPSANLPWPEPKTITGNVYSGTDPINITGDHDFTPTIANDGSTKVVRLKWTQTINTGTRTRMRFRNAANSADVTPSKYYNGSGTFEEIIVTSTGLLWRQLETGIDVDISAITLEEIDPLSVSIAMDGRMTYADEGATPTAEWYRWYQNSSNNIGWDLSTITTRTGEVAFQQIASGTSSGVTTGQTEFSPDINVPYSIASRHGSIFINGATDGVALTEDTTPTALPDLSAFDLSLAYDYMGTIGTFRVWDRDLGDDGIVEATNPSLEPSLSLTFEGTGTNSFVVNNWSE